MGTSRLAPKISALVRTLYADGNSTSPLTADGTIEAPFTTIGAALTAAAVLTPANGSPVQILVSPATYTETITIGSWIMLTAIGSGGQTRITPLLSTDTVVTGLANSVVTGFQLFGANGAGGRGYGSSSDLARVEDCFALNCETGFEAHTTLGIRVIAVNCVAARPNAGVTMVNGFACADGAQIHCFVCRALGTSASLITSGFLASNGAASETHVHLGAAVACINGFHADGALVECHAARVFGCTNQRRIGPIASSTLREGATIGRAVAPNLDLLNDGATSAWEPNGGVEVDIALITLVSDLVVSGTVGQAQTAEADASVRAFSDYSMGHPERPSLLAAGQGHATTYEMVTFQYDNSAASGSRFTDITAAAASRTGSTFGFPGTTQTTDAILWGVPRTWSGLNCVMGTAMSADGFLRWEFWDGAAWVEMLPGGTRGSGISVRESVAGPALEYLANIAWEATNPQIIQFTTELGAWTADDNVLDDVPNTGINRFWVRVRPDVLPTTFPLLQQTRIIYSSVVDGAVSTFLTGTARLRQAITFFSNLFVGAFGSVPSGQNLSFSANTNAGFENNSFSGNGLNRIGIAFPIPPQFDLSSPIEVEVEWAPTSAAAGNVEWQFDYGVSPEGAFAARSSFGGTLADFNDTQITASGGVADISQVNTFMLRVPQGNPQVDDMLFFMLQRDGSGGNPNDTTSAAAVIRRVSVTGLIWRYGKNV